MMGLLLAIFIIGLVILLLRKRRQQAVLPPPAGCEQDCEDEYLIAVITAAIQEYNGSGEFEVVRIKQRAQNWILTGRQNLLANR